MGKPAAGRDASRDPKKLATDDNVSVSREPSRTSSSLLMQARAGQDKGWTRLVDLYGSLIYRWCRRTGLSETDAADVAQEVFIAVARNIGEFRRDRPGDGFRKWLRTITTNKIRDHWRKRGNEEAAMGGTDWFRQIGKVAEQLEESLSEVTPRSPRDVGRFMAIERIREEVTPRDWRILERVVMDEHAPADVAREFNVSVNVVYLVRSRLLKRLREDAASETGKKQ